MDRGGDPRRYGILNQPHRRLMLWDRCLVWLIFVSTRVDFYCITVIVQLMDVSYDSTTIALHAFSVASQHLHSDFDQVALLWLSLARGAYPYHGVMRGGVRDCLSYWLLCERVATVEVENGAEVYCTV